MSARVAPDVIISEEGHHLLLGQRSNFGSAIGRVVQLLHTWQVELMVQDDRLEPIKVRSALISVFQPPTIFATSLLIALLMSCRAGLRRKP